MHQVSKGETHNPISGQELRNRNAAILIERLQVLETARRALESDIGAVRQAILKGSQMPTLDLERLARHLARTSVFLTAAKQACEEIVSSIAEV